MAPAIERKRPYHHGDLRQALLDSAERALAERGAAELSLRDLARGLGVSHAAPSRHFADKQALLDALAEHGFGLLTAHFETALSHSSRFDERLSALAFAYVGFATERLALMEVMFAAKHRPDAPREVTDAAERAFAVPLGLVAEGQAAGDVVAGEIEQVASATFATLHGLASLAGADLLPDRPLATTIGDVVERLVLGLQPR